MGASSVTGRVGASVAFVAFKVLRQAESTDTFSLQDMVGSTGRVSGCMPANHLDTGAITLSGGSHNMTATSDIEIPAGSVVKVVAVAGTNLVVAPTPVAT